MVNSKMKKLFYIGMTGLIIFEILNVFLIMPMPGSQTMNSVHLAYLLYQWRWVFRICFGLMTCIGLVLAHFKKGWVPVLMLVVAAAIIYTANFYMAADHMFYKPQQTIMANAINNKTDTSGLVIGIINNGEAKAYPIRFLGYHHQVYDTLGGKQVLVTYCTVCRTGSVYEPVVNGKPTKFRLVGMDHFNAMFEDEITKSWWRQATGEAITGPAKGQRLPEIFSTQTSLATWLLLNPASLIMQADPMFKEEYDTTYKFENGESRGKLTGTDSLSGKNKSWVVSVSCGNQTKAYDWNELKAKRMLQDTIGHTPVLLVLSADNKSFFAFERASAKDSFTLSNEVITLNKTDYKINGVGINTKNALKPLQASQEFLHSYKSFHL